jgi:carbon storage regulator
MLGKGSRLGPDITVMIVGVKGANVRVGIQAPRHIEVHRLEVQERPKQQRSIDDDSNG